MKRLFFIIATQILFMSIFTACNTSGSTETTVSTSVPMVDMNEPIIWNEYDRIDSVNSSNGILLYWPDALGAKSYRIYVNDNKPVTTTENTYMISSENANAKVFAIGENGEELAVLNWTAGERVETNVQEGWFDLYSMPTDSEIHLQSANGIPVSNLINLDMTSYSHVKICYEAKVLSYTTGPSHYTGRPDDCASAGVKICMGDTRTLISTERDSIVAGVGSATWGNAVSYSAGNEWHSYEVLMDNSQNIYTVFIDGDAIISGEQSARTMIANNVEFFAMGTAGNPTDVTLKNIKITCRTENILPIWDYSSKISSISHQDGFTLVWPAAINAEYYIVQIGENTPVKVTDNVYRAANLSHPNSGYDVKVQAYSKEGASLAVLKSNCNAKFNLSTGIDNREILTGSLGGSNSTKYAVYRIPGMIVTSKNTLIMFYEARNTPSDFSGMDLIAFRSTDGGETFSDPIMLAEGSITNTTMNNAVMIPDGDTIHLVYCVNYGICTACAKAATGICEGHGGGGVYYRRSTDDGITWSDPVNISDSTNPKDRYVIAPGPGTGIRTEDGTLIVPVWLVQKKYGDPSDPLKHSPGDIAPLYSEDGGDTWQIGEVIKADFSTTSRTEPLPVVLSDGRIMLNIRCYGGWRGTSVSEDGIHDFSTVKFDKELIDPFCNAGFAVYNHGDHPYTLIFTNCENNESFDITARKNLVLKASIDDGETWSMRLPLDPGDAGYSTIAVDQNGMIYILYEVVAGKHVRLVRMTYDYMIQNGSPLK